MQILKKKKGEKNAYIQKTKQQQQSICLTPPIREEKNTILSHNIHEST